MFLVRKNGVCCSTFVRAGGIAVLASLAMASTASAGRSPSTPPSITIGPATGQVPPGGVRPLNTDSGVCFTAPGENCTATFIMDTGRATATFLFSDGTSATDSTSCNKKTCTKEVTGHPNTPTRSAESVSISGPHISIIYVS